MNRPLNHSDILAQSSNTDIPEDARWWVAISNTGCERRATQGLQDRGFEVWWPIRVIQRKHRNAKNKGVVTQQYPAFPSYLFTRHANAAQWTNMIGVNGIRAVLFVDRVPVTVKASEIDRLKAELAPLEKSQAVVDLPAIGSHVTISEGPLAGVRALLSRIGSSGAVEVAVDMFGGTVKVAMDRSFIEAA